MVDRVAALPRSWTRHARASVSRPFNVPSAIHGCTLVRPAMFNLATLDTWTACAGMIASSSFHVWSVGHA